MYKNKFTDSFKFLFTIIILFLTKSDIINLENDDILYELNKCNYLFRTIVTI